MARHPRKQAFGRMSAMGGMMASPGQHWLMVGSMVAVILLAKCHQQANLQIQPEVGLTVALATPDIYQKCFRNFKVDTMNLDNCTRNANCKHKGFYLTFCTKTITLENASRKQISCQQYCHAL